MAQNSKIDESGVKYPIWAVDRRINELGAEQRITSEQDAQLLVGAILAKLQVDETKFSELNGVATRLAEAEYAAVRDPERRIPEGSVMKAFNLLMDRMSMPEFTHVSADELHAFRVTKCLILYPNWVVRQPDGNLPATVRPVEAAYLLYLLYINGGVSQKVRQAVSERGLPRPDPSSVVPPVTSQLLAMQPSHEEFQRRLECWKSRSRYLATHTSSDVVRILQDVFELITMK
jgi:hypothetical protein